MMNWCKWFRRDLVNLVEEDLYDARRRLLEVEAQRENVESIHQTLMKRVKRLEQLRAVNEAELKRSYAKDFAA